MDDFLRLDGRIVVVSGAGGGGIGTTITRMAAEAGATVVAVSRSKENLDEHIAPLAQKGLSVVPVSADASTDDGVAAVLDQVRRTEGNLYGLVNIAGGAAPATWMPSTRVSRSDWRELFVANLETAFFMSQAISRELRRLRLKGSIISLSSISGMNTAPFHIAYGTAKAAVVAMTRTMAVELASDNIRVNAVAPGVTETAASRTYTDHDPERDRKAIAMGRRGRPEEQAGAILFLLSDLSSYVTGQTLLVDGGLNLKWTHLGADNTSLFLKDESFRASISRFEREET
jgi:NAD(P)-dependent dehydrogenase (short-subunit alcohol dehydrogenase family)